MAAGLQRRRPCESYFKLNSPRFDSIEVSHIVLDAEGKAKEMMSVLRRRPGQLRRDGARAFDRRHARARRPDRQGAARLAAHRRRVQGVQRRASATCSGRSRRRTARRSRSSGSTRSIRRRLDDDTAHRGARAAARGLAARPGAGTRDRGLLGTGRCAPWITQEPRPVPRRFPGHRSTCSPRSRAHDIDRLAECAQVALRWRFGDTVCKAGDVGRRPVRDQVRLDPRLRRGRRQGDQPGRAQGRRRVGRDGHAARLPPRVVGARVGQDRAAVHPAQRHRPDRRGQPRGACLRRQPRRDRFRRRADQPAVRPARQGRQERARGADPQRRRQAGRRRQGDPEAGLARRPPALRGAPRRGAHRAPRGRHRLPAGHAAAGRHLRREGLPDAPGAGRLGDRHHRHRAAGDPGEDGSLHPRAQPEAARGAGRAGARCSTGNCSGRRSWPSGASSR